MKRNAVITGVNGFIGSTLAEYLNRHGLKVFGVDLGCERSALTRGVCAGIYREDVRDGRAMKMIMARVRPFCVFHLAAVVNDRDPRALFDTNVLGTKSVLDAVQTIGARVVVPGSAAEYGAVGEKDLPVTEETVPRPVSMYGLSKAAQTMIARQRFFTHKVHVVIARIFNVTGPGEPEYLVCAGIARQLKARSPKRGHAVIKVGNVRSRRDFVDVRDVARALWSIALKGKPGEIYNVCSGIDRSIFEIVRIFGAVSGVRITVKPIENADRACDVPVMLGCAKKIKRVTGWRPKISIRQSIGDLVLTLT